ncbi:Hsp20/alpha crystallin family protein [Salipiger profundus]|uniref:Hsp20/alpha crystallin family protein n=2 Tax=Roseobacteraceae TaxID=2854170 RepID=A0A1U7DB94_9RHOB|nr:Hsp20/alpha crystallin family protein [Salipiger profundus]
MLRDVNRFIPTNSDQSVFPGVNVCQGDDAVAVTAALPGIDPSDIDISVKDNVLTISGEREGPEVPDTARWHRNERRFGKFTCGIRLPCCKGDEPC